MNGYRGPTPAADLKFFVGKQPSKRARKRDVQWFRLPEARTLLDACQALKPRWVAFLMVCFGGGLRWGEATALACQDIDWARERVHVERTWSEDGGRIEACKSALGRVQPRPPASTLLDAGEATRGQLRDTAREDFMVEGKGFEPSTSALRTPRSPN